MSSGYAMIREMFLICILTLTLEPIMLIPPKVPFIPAMTLIPIWSPHTTVYWMVCSWSVVVSGCHLQGSTCLSDEPTLTCTWWYSYVLFCLVFNIFVYIKKIKRMIILFVCFVPRDATAFSDWEIWALACWISTESGGKMMWWWGWRGCTRWWR